MNTAGTIAAPAPAPGTRGTSRASLGLVLVVLGLGLAGLLSRTSRYHGDERFYTDAAVQMVQSGDYLTPRYADGGVRFLKPILTYWVITASYSLFGISLFSSRLPFLLAGLGVVCLTYALSRRLFGRRAEAVLAALIIASNYQLLALSSRSTPDALLCLLVACGLVAFAGLLFPAGAPSARDAWIAYLSLALAVEVKGLLGLCLLGFVLVFRLCRGGEAVPWRRLVPPGPLLVATTIAIGWYAVVFARHGTTVVEQFFADQLTTKTTFNPLQQAGNFLAFLGAALRHFLPWTLLLGLAVWRDWGGARSALRELRGRGGFLGGWFLALVVVFSFGNMYRSRYLVAAYPAVAVLLAHLLARLLDPSRWTLPLARALQILSVVCGGAAIGLATATWRWPGGAVWAAAWLAGLALVLGWVGFRRRTEWFAGGVALIPIVWILAYENHFRPVFSYAPAAALAERLSPDRLPGGATIYAWRPTLPYAGLLRVLSGGRLRIIELRGDTPWPQPTVGHPVIVTGAETNVALAHGYRLERAAAASQRWRGSDWRELLRASTPGEVMARKEVPYYLAWPEPMARTP